MPHSDSPQIDPEEDPNRNRDDSDQAPRTRARTRLQGHPDNPIQRDDPEGIHAPMAPKMPMPPRRRGRPRGSKNKRKADVYLSKKEQDDIELAIKLRREGKIITDSTPFEASGRAEIDGLIANGTFKIIYQDNINLTGI